MSSTPTSPSQPGERPSSPSSVYFPALDTLRGIFAVTVFGYHYFLQYAGHYCEADVRNHLIRVYGEGAFAVPFFFVLSSFLITHLLLEEKTKTGKVAIGRFYGRRILRVWPVYFLAFLVGKFVIDVQTGKNPTPEWIVPFAAFFANFPMTEGPKEFPSMAYAPLWSVSVEEQFYLVWPWLMRFVSEKRLLFVGIALIVAAPWVREIRFEFGHTTHPLQWYNTFGHLDSFGAGVVACLAYRSGHGNWLQRHLSWVAIAVLVGLCALQIGTGTMNNFPDLTVAGLISYTGVPLQAAVLILAGAQSASTLPPIWKHPVGLWFGRLSFGIYAYHGFAIVLLEKGEPGLIHGAIQCSEMFALTVAIASTSYYLVERPLLRLKSRLQVVSSGEDSPQKALS